MWGEARPKVHSAVDCVALETSRTPSGVGRGNGTWPDPHPLRIDLRRIVWSDEFGDSEEIGGGLGLSHASTDFDPRSTLEEPRA